MKNKFFSMILILVLSIGILSPASTSEAKASLPVTSLKLRVGSVYTMRPIAMIGSIKWTSSRKYVASVSKNGVTTAKDPGTTVIKASNGLATVSCKVKVKKKSTKKGSKFNPRTFPTTTPKGINFTYYMEGKKIGKFNIQIVKFAYGSESAAMAKKNSSNPAPTSAQQYLFFTVRLNYKSGTQTVKMSDVFNYNKNIFGAYGAKQLKPINWGFGLGSNESMKTVNISPGNTITADTAILVEKGFTPITFRLQTSAEGYTWVKL